VGYFVAINQLRGAAALLVVWAHLVGHWLTDRQLTWAPQTLVERFIAQPLGIIQHFGFLGVAIFFLISGFVITHAASKETVRVFVVRRLLRIYVPLAGALLVSLAAVRLGAPRGWNAGVPLDYADGISLGDALSAVSLVGYVTVPQVIVVGVAWTLAIEVVFYAFMAVVGPLLRRRRVPDVVVPVLLLSAVAAIVAASRSFGPSFFLFSVTCSYVPILIMGQAAYLASQRRVRLWEGLAVAGAAWAVFVWGLETLQPGFLSPGDAYGPSLTLAVGVFLVAVLAERHARTHRVLDVLAARSYSIYLVHGPVGLLVLDAAMGGGLAYRWALVAALAAAAVATEAMYRGFERPSIALARRLTRRGRSFRAGGPRT
ncbi:MAG TPA: acyltransferase, partial [Actinotalea sp.]|nr:acyltransferase [Actinotalea sp.]